jgi:hypothetical protein
MSSHKHKEHLQKIKDAITNANHLSQEEKSASLKRIEEWEKEDKASGIFYEELLNISKKLEPILAEIGLI